MGLAQTWEKVGFEEVLECWPCPYDTLKETRQTFNFIHVLERIIRIENDFNNRVSTRWVDEKINCYLET